jgi:hypothetical protein
VHGGARAKVGAPVKLTPDVHAAIVAHVAAGNYYGVAAEAAGIDPRTFKRWRDQGAEDLELGLETPFALLSEALARAQAEAESRMVRILESHALEDWRAAAWRLERRAPERWARRDKVDQTVTHISRPRDVTPDDSARDRIIELLRTATAPPAGADSEDTA